MLSNIEGIQVINLVRAEDMAGLMSVLPKTNRIFEDKLDYSGKRHCGDAVGGGNCCRTVEQGKVQMDPPGCTIMPGRLDL